MMRDKKPALYISDLLYSQIVTSKGKRIGHVVDIQISPGAEHRVTALVFGRYAWLYRLHVLHPFARAFGLDIEPDIVPWDAVERFERHTFVLKAEV